MVKNILVQIRKYRTCYKNWIEIIIKVFLRRETVAIMRNGNIIPSKFLTLQVKEMQFKGLSPTYDKERHIISFYFYEKLISIKGAEINGDLNGIFCEEVYGFLDVKGRYVIDVGMNIGDSAIYFAMRGAKMVMGFEPYKRVYDIAVENITSMNLNNIIKHFNAGVGSSDIIMTVPDLINSTDKPLTSADSGFTVPVYSLDRILEGIQSNEIMLKLDCEGCEYKALDQVKTVNLKKVKKIAMEYHQGKDPIFSKLVENGFIVKAISSSGFFSKKRNNSIGFIYAERY